MRKWTVPVIMSGGGGQPAEAQPDAAFSFLPFSIYDDGDGTFSIGSWDISTQVTRSVVRYVNKSGNDTTGDGLTVGTAWKTLTKAWTALAAVPNAAVIVGAGRYGWSDGGFNDNQTAITGRSLIADGDVVLDAYFAGTGSWALSGGYASTYEKTYAVVVDAVLDFGTLDANGDPTPYTAKASIAEVEAAEGSYYLDDPGNLLYVHALGHGSPGADVRPQYNGQRAPYIAVNDITTYWQGLKFYHTQPNWLSNAVSNTGVAYVKNCRFVYQASGVPIRVNGYTTYFQNCQYAHGITDLLTGDVRNTNLAKIVEIDCTGWDAGVTGSTGINASTNHNGGTNVVINGEYYNTYGPPIGFIGGGKAWILGTFIHDDLSTGDVTLLLQESAWLDRVVIAGNTTDISANTTIYVRDCTPASPSVTGGGSVAAY